MVAEAQSGNSESFGVIFEEFLNPIFRFIRMQVKSQDEAEDLTQEVFTKAWSRIDQFSDQGYSFSSWLYRIARTTTLDYFKKKKMVIVDDPEEVFGNVTSSYGNPVVDATSFEQIALVNKLLEEISHTDREVIVLSYVNDLSHSEVAKILNISEKAVRQRKSRALRSLRAKMNK